MPVYTTGFCRVAGGKTQSEGWELELAGEVPAGLAGAGGLHEHPYLQLNVDNLFDEVYYKKFAPTDVSYYYGDPRNVTLSLRGSL